MKKQQKEILKSFETNLVPHLLANPGIEKVWINEAGDWFFIKVAGAQEFTADEIIEASGADVAAILSEAKNGSAADIEILQGEKSELEGFLSAEQAAHAETQTALEAEQAAHAETKENMTAAHVETQTALEAEQAAHAETKIALVDAEKEIASLDKRVAELSKKGKNG